MQNLQTDRKTTLRYNADAARQVLARASEIDQAEQETLSAEHIEALGRELGLSPDAVRRALGEVQPVAVDTMVTTRTGTSLTRQRDVRGVLAGGAVVGLAVGVFLYFLLQAVSMTGILVPSPAMAVVIPLVLLFMAYGLAPLLAYREGWRKSDGRIGMIAGAAGGFFVALGAYVGIMLAVNAFPGVGAGFAAPTLYRIAGTYGTLVLMIGAAVAAGALGAKTRQW